MNIHHWHSQANTGNTGAGFTLQLTGKVTDVGRGAPHIKTEQTLETIGRGRAYHPHHPTGRTRQYGILARQHGCRGQATVRLHQRQRGIDTNALQLLLDIRQVTLQHRRQIGIRQRGFATGDQLDQRTDLVGKGDLFKAHGTRQRCQRQLVLRVFIGVHQHHGNSTQATVPGLLQLHTSSFQIQRPVNLAAGQYPLRHFIHRLIQPFRLFDSDGKQVRASLITNL